MIALVLFWLAVGLLAYTYVLFPVLLAVRARWRPQPYQSADISPSVSLIIAAHNEARTIGAKLENVLGLDYPPERLEVLVASDGSTDGTDAVVAGYAERGVRLLALARHGKAAALNAAAVAASGEILMFSDANSLFDPQAVRRLVRPFADPVVGGVAGNQCYRPAAGGGSSGSGEQSYWRLDRRLKQSQSHAGNAISATGAIYAIRRALFQPVPGGVTDDFVVSTGVIEQGYRLVFAADAVAYEPVAQTGGAEFGRKVRVITRGFGSVRVRRRLLDPRRTGFYAVQLFSHKVLRRLMFVPLAVLLVVSPLLWARGLPYRLAVLGQLGFYACALVGALGGGSRLGRSRPFAIPYFFCLVNVASAVAVGNVLTGRRIELWEPHRPETGAVPAGDARAGATAFPGEPS